MSERGAELYVYTTILDQVTVNGRISKKLFNKVIPKVLFDAEVRAFREGVRQSNERIKDVVRTLDKMSGVKDE